MSIKGAERARRGGRERERERERERKRERDKERKREDSERRSGRRRARTRTLPRRTRAIALSGAYTTSPTTTGTRSAASLQRGKGEVERLRKLVQTRTGAQVPALPWLPHQQGQVSQKWPEKREAGRTKEQDVRLSDSLDPMMASCAKTVAALAAGVAV